MDLALFARVLAWMLAAFFLGAVLGSLARSGIRAVQRRGRPKMTLTAPPAVVPDRPFFVDATIAVTRAPSHEGSGLAVLLFEGVGLIPASTAQAFRIEQGKHAARFEVSVPSATKDTVPRGRVDLVTVDGAIASACVTIRVDQAAVPPKVMASSR
jgi:hypothetical protein